MTVDVETNFAEEKKDADLNVCLFLFFYATVKRIGLCSILV